MFEELTSNPAIYAGAVGLVRGIFGYANNFLSGSSAFDGPKFIQGILRTGLMAYCLGFALGTPEAAWASVPLDMGYSTYQKK